MIYLSRIEDSTSSPLDTQLRNVIVTGDINFNMLSVQTSKNKLTFVNNFLSTRLSQNPHTLLKTRCLA